MEVKEVSTEEGVRAVSPVVLQLRTHLSEEELLAAVGRMRREGYRLIAAYDDEGGDPVGAAGFRVQEQKETLVDFEKETLPGVVLGQKQIPHTGRHRAFYDGIVFRAERNRGVDHGVYPSC